MVRWLCLILPLGAAISAVVARAEDGKDEKKSGEIRLPLKEFKFKVPEDKAELFAFDEDGERRTKALRDSAWAAHRAAQDARAAGQAAASDATRAALAAAGAAFLHPMAKATQVKHILGSGAHAARAVELSAGDDPVVGNAHIAQLRILARPVVVDVLKRYPVAPRGGGRVGELIRQLDGSQRNSVDGPPCDG
jgi:hypothetical protein